MHTVLPYKSLNYRSMPYPLNVTTAATRITPETVSSTTPANDYTDSILCYSCLSNDPNSGCGDQFNAGSPDANVVTYTVDGYSCYLEHSVINGADQYVKSTHLYSLYLVR